MHTTNYRNTLITVSADTRARRASVPNRPGTVAERQYRMIAAAPYALTSDDVIATVEADRKDIAEAERAAFRADYFATGRACLRTSPLVKSYGWGIHHDAEGRVALVARDSADYARLEADPAVAKVPGMRSSRA
ncbi:DUF6157 family protein [Wenxinia marina]|uniref:Uncharacterized protein n=1 Tax=Wenxinia marina DSM 24838 TaxID=1123501 RepID=A0A0D0NHJ3_9RHOB|nr:DUF6157 family protein [Wenxinia marina]KIQ67805.1 hypothetical protein Wenmar_03534 [Wenxinia marina DSM 24838]GGL74909.1 hypothetical protein GCM10011392_31930 [Wenxinia marina]